MRKRERRISQLDQKGMTLIEVMVSAGLAGVVFIALMFLLFWSSKTSREMEGGFQTIEGVTEAVQIFSTVLPNVTRVSSCLCQSNTNSRAKCIWDSSNMWYDPVTQGGMTNGNAILSGEFEAYLGTHTWTSLSGTYTSTISASGGLQGQSCLASSSGMAAKYLKGCKLGFSLNYWAPVAQSGVTPSTAGKLVLTMGTHSVQISDNTASGTKGYGLTALSCGFDNISGGGASGEVFVLNLRVKARQFQTNNTSDSHYESWFPTGTGYTQGRFRDVQLKYAMRNLSHRGVYFWRPLAVHSCWKNGTAASASNWEQCCSHAYDGSQCVSCVAGGDTATNNLACCSHKFSSGSTCQ